MKRKKIMIISFILILAAIVLSMTITYFAITGSTKLDKSKLENFNETPLLLDNKGNEIDMPQQGYVPINEISDDIKNAFISIEDKRFYRHNGVDYRRIFGAAVKNVKSMGFKEGASTITQQLIKNTHLNNEKTLSRKLKEWKLARQLEREYPKDKILEMYLNKIYFGNGIYGIGNACLRYYNKTPMEIDLSEAATLAGLVKSPNNYSPFNDVNKARARRDVVLNSMLNNGYISQNSHDKAANQKIKTYNGYQLSNYNASYVSNVMIEAKKILPYINSDYTVVTYLDQDIQFAAMQKLDVAVASLNSNGVLMSIDNASYGINSYASNIKDIDSIRRQGGSVLKPFITYMPALELNLISPATQILDEAININGYSPNNYGNSFHGYVSVRESIAHSYNIPSVKILNEIGIATAIESAERLGFEFNADERNLSLALGTNTVTPRQIASAYAALANGGYYKKALFIDKIYDKNGIEIYSNEQIPRKVYNDDNCYIMTNMLMSAVNHGTAGKLKYLNYDIAAKTGTVGNNEGNTDAYCAAYDTNNTFLSWIGNKDNLLPTSITGGVNPTIMIKNLIEAMPNYSPDNFVVPPSVVKVPINMDKLRKEQIIEYSPNGIEEYFTALNAPARPDKERISSLEEFINWLNNHAR